MGVSGLRGRLALAIAILSLLVVSAHSVAVYVITEDQEEARIDEVVVAEMEMLLARYRENPTAPPLRSHNLASYIVKRPLEREALPDHLRELSHGLHEVYAAGREWHVAVRMQDDASFYVAYDVAEHERRLGQLAWLLTFGVAATGIAAAVLGYALAGVLTRSVRDLAERVTRLDTAARVPLAHRYREREVRRLAQAFDEYSARMAQFLSREQEFTANVSHELRTPLTGIRTGCELLAEDPRLADDARRRVERIQRGAEQMSNLIESLLLLARSREARQIEIVALRECADEALEPLREMAAARDVELRNEVAAHATARADGAALRVVLANLLRNAVAGTHSGSVAVRLRAGALEVEDTGCGIEPEDLPHVFDRFYRGRERRARQGHGLGLAIVRQVCDRNGWLLTLDSERGRGTRVTLDLNGAD